MKTWGSMLALVMLPLPSICASATPIASDPIRQFIENEEFGQNAEVYVVRVDLNQDGINDFLISSNSEMRDGARSGTRWDIYASSSDGFVVVDNQRRGLYLRKDAMSIRPISNGRIGIVGYFPSNADSGTFTTYAVSDDYKLEIVSSKKTVVSDEKGGVDSAVLQESFGSNPQPRMQIIGESELRNEYQAKFAERKSTEPDFFYRRNKDNPRQTLVYSFKTKQLVGYEEDGKFTPIEKATAGNAEIVENDQSQEQHSPEVKNEVDHRADAIDRKQSKPRKPNLTWYFLVGLLAVGGLAAIYFSGKKK